MRDPGLRDRGAEVKVGGLVLLALVALVVGIFWISDTRLGGPSLQLVGRTPDAGQLTSEAGVYLRGVEVGDVRAVHLRPDHVLVELALYGDLELPADTRGAIRPAGFLGTLMVELVPGSAAAPLASGDTIALERSSDLIALASSLGEETTVILERIERMLSERMVADVQASSRSFSAAMRELERLLAGERERVHELLGNLDSVSARLAALTSGPELERSLANLDTLSGRLAAASSSFDSTSHALASLTTRLDRGEGSLGRMMTDETLYERLTEALENLQVASEEIALLTRDLRDQPQKYLRDVKFSVF